MERNESLRVLIIQPWIRLGGAELISVYLANEMQRLGHTAAVVCAYKDLSGMPRQASAVQYHTPPGPLSELMKRSRLAFLALAPLVLFVLTLRHAKGADVLNPHNAPSVWIAVLVGVIRRIPVIWTCNEPPGAIEWRDVPTVGLADSIGWLVMSSPLDRLFVRHVAHIYVPSQMTRTQVWNRYGIEASIIPIGVDVDFFQAPSSNGSIVSSALDGKRVLLVVGKLHPQKNQKICLRALQEVLPWLPDAVLVMAGDGPMRAQLEAQAEKMRIREQVHFIGRVDSHTVRDLYRACDINLVSAINQSWGLTPFEAMCSGKPSVVSAESGAAELIGEIGFGVVSEPSGDAFASAILGLIRSQKSSRDSAARGLAYVQKNLSWGAYAEKVVALFKVSGRNLT